MSSSNSTRRRPLAELHVRVTPRASRNRVEPGNPLQIYVTAPPLDGEANCAVTEVLSKFLGVARSRLTIVKGTRSRLKTVEVQGLSETELAKKLASII